MLRYDRQSKPGLVALYDIRPGNGAGPFLQPWSPHGAQPIHGSVSAKVENIGCKYSQLECVHAEEHVAEIYFIPATLTSSKKSGTDKLQSYTDSDGSKYAIFGIKIQRTKLNQQQQNH